MFRHALRIRVNQRLPDGSIKQWGGESNGRRFSIHAKEGDRPNERDADQGFAAGAARFAETAAE